MTYFLRCLRRLRQVPALALVALASLGAAAHAEDFLDVDKAFVLSARAVDASTVEVRYTIAPAYYMYRSRFAAQASQAKLGANRIPAGVRKFDPNLNEEVETFHDAVNWRVPVTQAAKAFVLDVTSQGCAEAGLCYPPQTQQLRVSLAAFGGDGTVRVLAEGEDPRLPPAGSPVTTLGAAKAVSAAASAARPVAAAAAPSAVPPQPVAKADAPVAPALAFAPAAAPGSSVVATEQAASAAPLSGGLLLPAGAQQPADQAVVATAALADPSQPAAAADADTGSADGITAALQSKSWWGAVGLFFALGLALALTPCVLPMLPILSSIIAGGGPVTRMRGLLLAATYSLGMSLVYTALGVAAGLAGEGLAAALQQPWVLITFAVLLAVLSLSMFGVYELRLPSALATRLDGASRALPGGQLIGVFLMGGLSALVVSPCVSAPLAGALVFISQTKDVWLGGTALFVMAWGMSVPLLLLGASAGAWLPRGGAWMNVVKGLFGALLLGVALWIVQPLLPSALVLAAWGVLLLLTGFMLDPLQAGPDPTAPSAWVRRALGGAALLLGAAQLLGALSGGSDALQPLRHFAGGGAAAGGATASAAPATAHALPFERVRTSAELDARLAQAAAAGRPVMLDFYADWCVSCKEMERFTFTDPGIQARLKNAVLLQADVTANNADDKALYKRFGLFGPPGIIFWTAQGEQRPGTRVIGFQNAAAFTQSLTRAGL